ncbi:zinc finger protein 772 [Oryctolagus cuniculus]|uniref:zinc finger protein 772 n=1 Tax=Oryctolagus cuniculus TaxID=9986 RepID=UPI00387A0927
MATAAEDDDLDFVPVVPGQQDHDQRCVTLKDVFVYLSHEEWKLLDEDQKCLYYDVMLNIFLYVLSLRLPISRSCLLTQPEPESQPRQPDSADVAPVNAKTTKRRSGPGYWYTEMDEDAHSEEGVLERISQVRSPEAGPSTQETQSCDICEQIVTGILHLAEQGTTSGLQPYICTSCGRDLWFSLQQCEEKFSRGGKGQSSFVNSLACLVSEKAFTSREDGQDFLASSELVQHQATHNEENPHRSTACVEAQQTGQGQRCSECGEVFRHKDQLIQHQKSHTREQPYECIECGKSFSRSQYLTLHQKIHRRSMPFKCNDCGKLFSCRSRLVIHQTDHTRSKLYGCAECGKFFSRHSILVQHKITHTGARPRGCDECGKNFRNREILAKHKKTHSGEKPYTCSICVKSFKRKCVFIDHMKVHTKKPSYECNECGKLFQRNGNLLIHKRNHSVERLYVCSECGKAFITRSHLTQHQKVHTRAVPMDEVNVESSVVATPEHSTPKTSH